MKAQGSRGRKAVVKECRLCGVQARLQRSHVVPKLMFRAMQRFGPEIMPHQTGPEGTRPRPGHAKEYMLCAGCESQFSTYERVAGRFLADLNQYEPRAGERVIQWSALDYAHLKLFFLSMLWRCAVAEHPMSRQMDLGPRLTRLTELLRSGDPGGREEFPVLLRIIEARTIDKFAVVTFPAPMRESTRRGLVMVGYGVEISWITDARGAGVENASWILREDGTWLIEVIPGARSIPWREAIARADEADRRLLEDPRARERLKRRVLAYRARRSERSRDTR